MRTAITIAFNQQDQPELISDTRTPASEQQKYMSLLKTGAASPPDGAFRLELWDSETGVTMRWQETKPITTKTKTKGTK